MQLLLETFLILRRNQRDIITNAYRSSRRFQLKLADLVKHQFCRQVFKNPSNLKFHEDLSSGNRVVQCGRMGGRKETNKTKLTFEKVKVSLKSYKYDE
jgi:hypothetical protein